MKIFSLLIVALSEVMTSFSPVKTVSYEDGRFSVLKKEAEGTLFSAYSEKIPSAYTRKAKEQGSFETISYTTHDYTGQETGTYTKQALVYLPYGYEENTEQSYDVIYFLHGAWGTTERYLPREKSSIANVLDHLIEQGEMEPSIFVAATWDLHDTSRTDETRGAEEIMVYQNEVRNELLPAVEARYRTYAKSTDIQGLQESRRHRTIAGFSYGAVAVWNQLLYNKDLFETYIPVAHDCWDVSPYGGYYRPQDTAERIAEVIEGDDLPVHIYAGVGEKDEYFEQVDRQMQDMYALDTFNEDNFTYYKCRKIGHSYDAVTEILYTVLKKA